MLFNVQCWWYRWRYPLTVRLPPGATGAPPSPLSQQLDKNTFVICLPSMMSPITRLSASLQILKLCHFFWAISLDKMFFFLPCKASVGATQGCQKERGYCRGGDCAAGWWGIPSCLAQLASSHLSNFDGKTRRLLRAIQQLAPQKVLFVDLI